MNPRERILAMGLLGVLVLVGGYFALLKPFYLDALRERDSGIAKLEKDIDERSLKLAQIRKDLPRLERWRQLSLPTPVASDADRARREYEEYLKDLLSKSGFQATNARVTSEAADTTSSPKLGPKKEPIYMLLPYKVQAHGDLSNLVGMLERFYRTGLLHRIKNLSIQRPLTTTNAQQRTGELDIDMTVEAVIINGADTRPYLMFDSLPMISRRLLALDVVTAMRGGPAGVALVPWAVGPAGPLGPRILAQPKRQYASITAKNIFAAPTRNPQDRREVEATRFVFLQHIERNEKRSEALLYDLWNNKLIRVRPEKGFDSFGIRDDEDNTVVRGKIIRIGERDVVFSVDENYYSIHMGQSLQDALETKLSPERLKELGIATASADKVLSGQ